MTVDTATHKSPLVLVSDDDPDILKIVSTAVESANCKVITAVDGLQAQEKLKEHDFDLLILDLMMPKLDGSSVCRDFKSTETGKLTPVLILTAKVSIQDKVSAFQDGADDYLTKPFNYYELQSRVKALLRVRQMNLNLQAKNNELIKMQEKLVEQERQLVVQQLAGSTAHNLGQPLSAILLNLHALKEINQENPLWLKSYEAIRADLKRALVLIEKLKKSDANNKTEYHGNINILELE